MTNPVASTAYPLHVVGSQRHGWMPTTKDDPTGRLATFRCTITDDGVGLVLLIIESTDGSLYAVSEYLSLKLARAAAHNLYGIADPEWEAHRRNAA